MLTDREEQQVRWLLGIYNKNYAAFCKELATSPELMESVRKLKKPHKAKNEYPELFEKWYEHYPRKIAKPEALRAFQKHKFTPEDVERLIAAVELQKKTAWQGKNIQYIPHPSTWINQGRWTDEVGDFRIQDRQRSDEDKQRKQLEAEYQQVKGYLLDNQSQWDEWEQTNNRGLAVHIRRLRKEMA